LTNALFVYPPDDIALLVTNILFEPPPDDCDGRRRQVVHPRI